MGAGPMACMYKEEQMVPEAESSLLVTSEPYVRGDGKVALPQPDSEDEDEEDAYDLSSEDLWPLLKLQGQLKALSAQKPSLGERRLAVLLTTGAMNPLHRGHAQLMYKAAERLEREGFNVVGAWLSPSHDGYVQPKARKAGTIGLSSQFRLEAARRAVMNDQLVDIGQWEANKPGKWPDYPEVTMALQRKLQKVEKEWSLPRSFQVFYACGTDHANSQGLYRGFLTERGCGVVVVPRLGEQAKKEEPSKNVFVAQSIDGEGAGYNSTMVRSALKIHRHSVVTKTLHSEAADFLLRPSSQELERFREDFEKLGVDVSA